MMSADDRFARAVQQLRAERRAALAAGREPRYTIRLEDAWAQHGRAPVPDAPIDKGDMKAIRTAYRAMTAANVGAWYEHGRRRYYIRGQSARVPKTPQAR